MYKYKSSKVTLVPSTTNQGHHVLTIMINGEDEKSFTFPDVFSAKMVFRQTVNIIKDLYYPVPFTE